MRGRKGVFFDTSTWSPIDLLDFYRQIPPEQVLYASDYPYGQQPSSLLLSRQDRALARATTTTSCALMLAGNANALADGAELPEPTEPMGTRHARAAAAARADPRSTCRWRRRCSGRASPTRSACSGSRSTRAPSATGTATRSTGSASCSSRGARPVGDRAGHRGRSRGAADDAAHAPARAHGADRGDHMQLTVNGPPVRRARARSGRRSPRRSARSCRSPARRSRAARATAARAPCSSTASPCSRASRSCTRSTARA